ncbi:MAG: ATP-dependent DNA helicase [Acidimicrobiales bacterium]
MRRLTTADALRRVTAKLPDGGEARAGQLTMAEAVAASIAAGRHLSVAAGTGTGKSLAYLVPAVLSGRHVVVATATKALQDQLAHKDIPLVAAGLRRFSSTVLKGRSNYLCVQRLNESRLAGTQGILTAGERSPDERGARARRIFAWADRTVTGDRAELVEEPDPQLWSAFSVSAEECPGAFRCPSGGECFAERARAAATAADVVVVNLHLLGADIAADGAVLPRHDVLVVDEAHALEDIVTDSLGVSISAGRLRSVAAAARAALGAGSRSRFAAVDDLAGLAERLEEALLVRSGERLGGALGGDLEEVVGLARARLGRLESVLGELVEVGDARGAESSQPAMRAMLAAGRLRTDIDRLVSSDDDDVAWVDQGARPALRVAPIDVAPTLAAKLFANRTVVLTSATIPPGLGVRLGAAAGEIDEIDVGSPFAFDEHALLYCAAHLPDRRRDDAEKAIHEELVGLIEAAQGRTLALFTSLGAMTRAADACRARLAFPLLVQGDLGKAALLARFAKEPAACLFATMGFWQGVDVPGSTLSLVVIDRIPFPRPDDPLIAARRDRAGRDAFATIDLPRAATLLAQGVGRLIRSASDRGVVAVLDSRLATASYRWQLIRALPPMRRTKDRRVAEEFLRTLAGRSPQ